MKKHTLIIITSILLMHGQITIGSESTRTAQTLSSGDVINFMESILYNKIDVIKNYLQNAGDPNITMRDIPITTLLGNASSLNRIEIIKTLLAYGAKADEPCDNNRNTPLMIAVRKKNKDAIIALLVAGASTTTTNAQGLNAARIAQHVGYEDELNKAIAMAQLITINALEKINKLLGKGTKEKEEKNNQELGKME